MSTTRRSFLHTAVIGAAGIAAAPGEARSAPHASVAGLRRAQELGDRFDPWIEVDEAALAANVAEVTRLTSGRPILAVVKNNAYGLDVRTAAALLEPMPQIAGFAVVRAEAAISLRESGVRKPILLMALFSEGVAPELARHGIVPCLYSDDAPRLVGAMARAVGAPVGVHVYLDTGMSRMGVPWRDAHDWLKVLANRDDVRFDGVFTGFTEDPDFDREQLRRFRSVTAAAASSGVPLGVRHAASSAAVFELPEAHLDMVRPGMALYGGYPNDPARQRDRAALRSAVRLKARVVRTQELRPGDTVSYGRNYVARRRTWVATLPVGHTDGFPRSAVDGGRVLIGGRTFPVIGAVSASHTIIEVGPERTVAVGDVATLVGPDVPEIDPNRLSAETGVSIYDVFMHLDPRLPRVVA